MCTICVYAHVVCSQCVFTICVYAHVVCSRCVFTICVYAHAVCSQCVCTICVCAHAVGSISPSSSVAHVVGSQCVYLYAHVVASRDATMALWSVPTHYPVEEYCPNEEDHLLTLAENVPVIKPIFHFSNTTLTSMGDRVRGLAYNEHCYELASLQTSNEAVLYFWDVFVFQPVRKSRI